MVQLVDAAFADPPRIPVYARATSLYKNEVFSPSFVWNVTHVKGLVTLIQSSRGFSVCCSSFPDSPAGAQMFYSSSEDACLNKVVLALNIQKWVNLKGRGRPPLRLFAPWQLKCQDGTYGHLLAMYLDGTWESNMFQEKVYTADTYVPSDYPTNGSVNRKALPLATHVDPYRWQAAGNIIEMIRSSATHEFKADKMFSACTLKLLGVKKRRRHTILHAQLLSPRRPKRRKNADGSAADDIDEDKEDEGEEEDGLDYEEDEEDDEDESINDIGGASTRTSELWGDNNLLDFEESSSGEEEQEEDGLILSGEGSQ